MKCIKQTIRFMLVLTLLFGSISTVKATETTVDELTRAAALGFDMEHVEQKTVSGQEFAAIMDHFMVITAPEKLGQWQSLHPLFRANEDPLGRGDAAVYLYLAANFLGGEWEKSQRDADQIWEMVSGVTENPYDGVFFDVELFEETVRDGQYDIDWLGSCYLDAAAYNYNAGRVSAYSNQFPLAYDEQVRSFHIWDQLTYRDAVLAAVRLFDSSTYGKYDTEWKTELDDTILHSTQSRKSAILNSASDWTVGEGGKVYYVSPGGDDNNDGLSPESAWKSLGKVNSAAVQNAFLEDVDRFPEFQWAADHRDQWAELKPGDVVLFERGGLWRGSLRTAEGVTYSAYGEGAKPEIWSSPENGASTDKWTLVEGTDNVWQFHRELQDCGGILLSRNGEETIAEKGFAFWKDQETGYLDFKTNPYLGISKEAIESATPLDIKTMELDDLQFFNEIIYPVDYAVYGAFGKLYLRCDEGNPGTVYDSIEFFTGTNDWQQGVATVAEGSVLDNFSFRYGATGIGFHENGNGTVQNCCVGWIGGMILSYELGYNELGATEIEGANIVRCGDGIYLGGNNCIARNNYIYQTYDFAVTMEAYNGAPPNGVSHLMSGHLVSDNLIEYCPGGIAIFDWFAWNTQMKREIFTDLTIENNCILSGGMGGWAHQDEWKIAEDEYSGGCYMAPIVICVQPGCEDIVVKDNILYRTWQPGPLVTYGYHVGYDCVDFSGNTYVQNPYGRTVTLWYYFVNESGELERGDQWYWNEVGLTAADILGDTTGIAPVPIFDLPEPADMSGENLLLSGEVIFDEAAQTTSVRVTFKNKGTGILVTAGYTEEGKMCCVSTQMVSKPGMIYCVLPVAENSSKIRAFFVDQTYVPLCMWIDAKEICSSLK